MKYLALFGLLLSFSAHAEDAPSHPVDMTTLIYDEHNQPVKDFAQATPEDKECKACPQLTIGLVIYHALAAGTQGEHEPQVTWEQKWARTALGDRIKTDKAAKLTAPEVALIERLVGASYNGIVIKQVVPLIDPNAKPPEVQ